MIILKNVIGFKSVLHISFRSKSPNYLNLITLIIAVNSLMR
jgi:hypothetical protein